MNGKGKFFVDLIVNFIEIQHRTLPPHSGKFHYFFFETFPNVFHPNYFTPIDKLQKMYDLNAIRSDVLTKKYIYISAKKLILFQ